jgi:RNA polymerase II elongation factor ELL
VRPYDFPGLTDDERRKMWRQARQFLYILGIPETDPAWDHVRTQPGSTGTGPAKAAAGPKRATGTVNAERKKNTGSTSKPLVEAKDEGVRPSQTAKVREESIQAARSTKAVPMRDDNPPPRRPPGVSGPKNAREVAPTQAQGPSKKTGPADARAKPGGSSKLNGRSGPATHIPASSSHERELERERHTHPLKKEKEDVGDLDREKGKAAAVPKAKRRKDDMSDLDSLRDWDGTDTMGKAKRKKLREDYDDKDRINGTVNTVKRRKVLDDDKPYKPGGGGGGGTKARERDRDKELDRGKTGDRDPPHVAKRPRDSDWDSPDPPAPPPRKSTVRERERQREREPDRSVSPPRRVKREYSLSPALHNSHQRENSPLPRATAKRADSPARHAVKRESSPRLRGHSRRDDSPLAPQTSSKRAASPSRSQNRQRERHRETSTSRRRRSPIYTSSEDEQQSVPVRRNPPSSVTSSSSSREAVRTQGHALSHPPPPTVPYPKDREALEARYRSGYRNYIAVYYKLLDERAKIQDALEDVGREGSVGSDRDVEMMDEEGLRELKGQYSAWTRELEGIRNAYSAEARMDIKT